MAVYTITFSEDEDWNDSLKFSYLNSSSKGYPTAQDEFNRLRYSGCQFARLISWSHNRPTEIARFGQGMSRSSPVSSLESNFQTNGTCHTIRVEFLEEPYTLRPIPGFRQVNEAPHSCGVYLWCIKFRGAYLVNYVGKADGRYGIQGRLTSERNDFRNWERLRNTAKHCWEPVDIDEFKHGNMMPTTDPEQIRRQVLELEPLFWIVVSTALPRAHCRRAENEIVYRLREHDFSRQFLYNGRGYRHDGEVEIPPVQKPLIIGLTTPVPPSL